MEQNINEMTNWKDLFSLYRDLVGPFQELENRLNHKWDLELTARDARGIIDYGYKRTIREAFSHTRKIIWALPFLGVFHIVMNVVPLNGETLFYYYEDLLETITYNIYPFHQGLIGSFIYAIMALIIIYFLLPCLIFLFPLMIVGNVIYRTHVISKAKKTLKSCEELLPQADAAIQETWNSIAPYVEKVPPNYRTSHALAFFANSFFNFKVRNLQEAVNLYDDYLHKQRMEQSQREMLEAQRESMNAINALSGQMDYIHAQMDFMQDQISSLY